ncbi:MAG: hypothetical protein H0T54_05560 [Geodermatophilaceae bacterium]|nr:hypothetical protein [Geodermatophilaceae bacterium]
MRARGSAEGDEADYLLGLGDPTSRGRGGLGQQAHHKPTPDTGIQAGTQTRDDRNGHPPQVAADHLPR